MFGFKYMFHVSRIHEIASLTRDARHPAAAAILAVAGLVWWVALFVGAGLINLWVGDVTRGLHAEMNGVSESLLNSLAVLVLIATIASIGLISDLFVRILIEIGVRAASVVARFDTPWRWIEKLRWSDRDDLNSLRDSLRPAPPREVTAKETEVCTHEGTCGQNALLEFIGGPGATEPQRKARL